MSGVTAKGGVSFGDARRVEVDGEWEGEDVTAEFAEMSGEERVGGEPGVQGREECFIAERRGGRGI